MSRKTIAVFVTGYDSEYETRIIDGIYRVCQEEDINICCFASMVRKPPINMNRQLDAKTVAGETEIFNLINCNLVDGILILGDNLVNEDCIFEIAKRAKAKDIPVININDILRIIDHNILVDNRDAMEHVVRHLVRDHGLKKINFIGGFPGNIQTEERLAAYKRVLAEFSIPYEESRVSYGEFWLKAKDCCQEFIDSGDLPEAIVCASDTMALFCIDVIKENGLRVPEDIVVTGFDGIVDCETSTPTLTTVRPAYRKLGMESVYSLIRMWNGEDVPQVQYVESELVKHGSCGCDDKVPEITSYYHQKYDVYNDFKRFNSLLIDMNLLFSKATTSAELYAAIEEGAEFFKFKKAFICICNNIENGSDIDDTKLNIKRPYGLTENSVVMYDFNKEIPVGHTFKTRDLLPIDFLHEEKPCFMAFSSLYFQDRFLGYLAYEPSKTSGSVGVIFQTWVLQIGNHAGSFYLNAELKTAVNQLDDLYARDFLTGLYNRRGMSKNSYIIDQAKQERAYITVIACDVDNLKVVNDHYGHEGGDYVIRSVAQALSLCLPEGTICVRTGGDEFIAFFKHDKLVNVDEMLGSIDSHLEKLNSRSSLPYKSACSCGYYSQLMDDDVDFNEMCKIADDKMYAVKYKKKALRQ